MYLIITGRHKVDEENWFGFLQILHVMVQNITK